MRKHTSPGPDGRFSSKSHPVRQKGEGPLLGGGSSVGGPGTREAVSDHRKHCKEEMLSSQALFLWKPCSSSEGAVVCDLGRAFLIHFRFSVFGFGLGFTL